MKLDRFQACQTRNSSLTLWRDQSRTHFDDIALLVILWIPIPKLYDHRPDQVCKLALDVLVYPLIIGLSVR